MSTVHLSTFQGRVLSVGLQSQKNRAKLYHGLTNSEKKSPHRMLSLRMDPEVLNVSTVITATNSIEAAIALSQQQRRGHTRCLEAVDTALQISQQRQGDQRNLVRLPL